MGFQKDFSESLPIAAPPCIHLRSKTIYVTGEHRVPNHAEEEQSDHCWCNLTQHVIGPDQGEVDRPNCIQGRPCFQ